MAGGDQADEGFGPLAKSATPSEISLVVLPVEVPEEYVQRQVASRRHYDRWSSWYGVDLSPLGTLEPNLHQYAAHPPQRGPVIGRG